MQASSLGKRYQDIISPDLAQRLQFDVVACGKNINVVLCHLFWSNNNMFCVYIGLTGPVEPPEDDEMTLPSRHMIRNSSPGGLRPSMLPLGHGGSLQYCIFLSEWGRNILFL